MKRLSRLAVCMFYPLISAALAQGPSVHQPMVTPLENRHVLVLPEFPARSDEELEFGAIQVHSIETGSERIHLVVLEGQAYRASTPLEGEFSRLVFDPVRREFVPLLPSIRVELEDMGRLESIAEAIGANGAIPFKALGFAIIELPESVHPLDAVRRLQAPPYSLEAWIRVRGQRLSWR